MSLRSCAVRMLMLLVLVRCAQAGVGEDCVKAYAEHWAAPAGAIGTGPLHVRDLLDPDGTPPATQLGLALADGNQLWIGARPPEQRVVEYRDVAGRSLARGEATPTRYVITLGSHDAVIVEKRGAATRITLILAFTVPASVLVFDVTEDGIAQPVRDATVIATAFDPQYAAAAGRIPTRLDRSSAAGSRAARPLGDMFNSPCGNDCAGRMEKIGKNIELMCALVDLKGALTKGGAAITWFLKNHEVSWLIDWLDDRGGSAEDSQAIAVVKAIWSASGVAVDYALQAGEKLTPAGRVMSVLDKVCKTQEWVPTAMALAKTSSVAERVCRAICGDDEAGGKPGGGHVGGGGGSAGPGEPGPGDGQKPGGGAPGASAPVCPKGWSWSAGGIGCTPPPDWNSQDAPQCPPGTTLGPTRTFCESSDPHTDSRCGTGRVFVDDVSEEQDKNHCRSCAEVAQRIVSGVEDYLTKVSVYFEDAFAPCRAMHDAASLPACVNRAEAEFKQRAEKLRPQLGSRYQLISVYGASGCDMQQLMALLNRAVTSYAHSFVSPSRAASDRQASDPGARNPQDGPEQDSADGSDESSSDASEGDSEDPSDEEQSDSFDDGGSDVSPYE